MTMFALLLKAYTDKHVYELL